MCEAPSQQNIQYILRYTRKYAFWSLLHYIPRIESIEHCSLISPKWLFIQAKYVQQDYISQQGEDEELVSSLWCHSSKYTRSTRQTTPIRAAFSYLISITKILRIRSWHVVYFKLSFGNVCKILGCWQSQWERIPISEKKRSFRQLRSGYCSADVVLSVPEKSAPFA